MTTDFQYTVSRDEVTGVYKGTLDIQLPPICVTRYKADKNDFKYEYECSKVSYTISHMYCPDFVLPNGVILECKGYWDSADRKKIKSVKEQNPDLDLRMVFQLSLIHI